MSHHLDDPEFWLPPLFLSDDSVTDFKKSEFLISESNSGFSSPVDSSIGSTETESDEDEFLTELTRRLTYSTHLSHDLWKQKPNHGFLPGDKTNTSWKMPTPQQSTHCKEEAAKITTMLQQDSATGYNHFWAQPQKHCLDSVTINHAYLSNQRSFYQPQQQIGNSNGLAVRLLSPSAWPTLQQSQSHKQPVPVCWTNAALLKNNNVTKRGCSGTGVFLPRPVATIPTETPRRKQQPVAFKQRKALTQSQQKRDISRSPATMNNEIRLPQEWTY